MPAPTKGNLLGECNRKACDTPLATWFNHGTQRYYCIACARAINEANPEGQAMYGHPLCTPYVPPHLAFTMAPLPALDHAPGTPAEFMQVGKSDEALALLQTYTEESDIVAGLTAIVAMPLFYYHDHAVWVPNEKVRATNNPAYATIGDFRGRTSPGFRTVMRHYKDIMTRFRPQGR